MVKRVKKKRLIRCGKSVEWYEAKLADQQGGCAFCSRPPKRRRHCVDHDHGDDTVRGILCSICNRRILGVIERYRVNPERIVAYLKRYGSVKLNIVKEITKGDKE